MQDNTVRRKYSIARQRVVGDNAQEEEEDWDKDDSSSSSPDLLAERLLHATSQSPNCLSALPAFAPHSPTIPHAASLTSTETSCKPTAFSNPASVPKYILLTLQKEHFTLRIMIFYLRWTKSVFAKKP